MREVGRSLGTPYGLLVWLWCVAAWLTWTPFVLREGTPEIQLLLPSDLGHLLGNLLILAPLAVVVALRGERGEAHSRLREAIAVTAVTGFVLEAGQWFIFGRVISPWDPLLNIAGASAGAWAADPWHVWWLAGWLGRLHRRDCRPRQVVFGAS